MSTDQFHHWRSAVEAGKPVDTDPGNVRSGYYRPKRGREAAAFWRDEFGLHCWRSGTYRPPTLPDEIEDFFAMCAPYPIAYEVFKAFKDTGTWPEDIAPAPAPAPELSPVEAITAEIDARKAEAAKWLEAIGGVRTQVDADKSATFADEFSKLEAKAAEIHRAEKAPFLEGGRKVDAMFKPLVERAASLKTWAKNTAAPYLIAEKKRLADEAAARKAEADRIEKENMAARVHAARIGAPPPVERLAPIPPPPQKAKAGTSGRTISLRTRTVYRVVDLRAFLVFVSQRNDISDQFREAALCEGERLTKAGIIPPGIEKAEEEFAA